ncbi:uncharacterized protein LOC143297303 [Babylonia areolata]|uniref:uncharacterized protein LOC143297303 n=1 Tax=Babylonia areolata TaxID=304850 RepID=UPI003FD6AE86
MESLAAITSGSDKPKRSFEFRMCKKVAELTQVVHMLFTRNHEREIEMQALKDAYELEISEVISDAESRISRLRQEQENMLKQQTGDTDRIRKLLAGEFESKEQDWRKRVEDSERHLREERTECQNLRDMLIRAQQDIENLRRGVTDQMSSQSEEVARRDRDMDRLKKQIQYLEHRLRSRDQESGDAIRDLEQSRDSLERELRQVQGSLEESSKAREQLMARNRQLEADLKALKRELNRKMADMVNGQKANRNGSALSQSQNEELERLRREIQRYRLELINRDANFNRMFTDKQPIHLDRSGTVGGLKLQTSHSAGTVHSAMNGASSGLPQGTGKREKTQPSGPVILFQEQEASPLLPSERQRAMSTPSAHLDARDSHLPSICSSPDAKPRPYDSRPRPHDNKPRPHDSRTRSSNNRLSKPRPLPKDMLFGE